MDEMREGTFNAAWRKLWPEVVPKKEKKGKQAPSLKETIESIVAAARKLQGEGLEDMKEEDVLELLESHSEELSEEDLEEMMSETAEFKENEDDENDDEDDEHATPTLTLTTLTKFLQKGVELHDEALAIDPFMERSLKFKRGLIQLLAPYFELQTDLRRHLKQTTLQSFFSKKD